MLRTQSRHRVQGTKPGLRAVRHGMCKERLWGRMEAGEG